jgi:hypothetical protein
MHIIKSNNYNQYLATKSGTYEAIYTEESTPTLFKV